MATEIKFGDVGDHVLQLQGDLTKALRLRPGALALDGNFSKDTHTAVMMFQEAWGLRKDGIVGPKTRAALTAKLTGTVVKPERGKVISLTDQEVMDRVTASIGAPVTYHLSYPNGGTDPDANMPCDEATGYLDCSGANAWWHGFDRYQEVDFPLWDGYINTDSKIAEAERFGFWFTVQDEPEVGDIIVGETYRNFLGKRVIGHEGTITKVDNWKVRGLAGLGVVHCSASNWKAPGNRNASAIWQTDGTVWKRYKKVRFLRFNREKVLQLKEKA